MCGRYVLEGPVSRVQNFFDADLTEAFDDYANGCYNIAPTMQIPVVRINRKGERVLIRHRWGLIPSWAKDATIGAKLNNARGETVHEKPSFRKGFKHFRCLIPASGYYEWQAPPQGSKERKQPFYISARDGLQLPIAGIWSSWRSPNGEVIETASIITQEARGELETIHSRMPVFMPPDRWDLWLNPRNTDVNELKSLMVVEQPESIVIARPVSDAVNSVANNGKELTVETPLGEPETLF